MHIHRFGFADVARQALRAADPSDHTEVDLGLAEFSVVACDDEIAHHCEFTATAQRVASNGCDDRFLCVVETVAFGRKELCADHINEGFFRHFGDVSTSGKCLFRTSDDDAAHLLVFISGFECIAQFAEKFRVQRIESLGTVQGYQCDVSLNVDDDGLISHVQPLLSFSQDQLLNKAVTPIKLSLALRTIES